MPKAKKIDLALQGGGAHGAYSWGVIDRLLEEEDIQIDGVCGTSAGAMNGVCLIYGLSNGGREGGKKILNDFWKKVSEAGKFNPLKPSWYDRALSPGNMDYSPGYRLFSMMTDNISPMQFNPMGFNPLEKILNDLIDFDLLKKINPPKLFICATDVMNCSAKVFGPQEISIKSCLASACLPYLFPAVEIDGNHYWDGGYMGNPPLYPLIVNTPDTNDILLVQINPFTIKKVPKSIEEIRDRVNEISFNSSLKLELENIVLHREIAKNNIGDNRYKKVFLHKICADEDLSELNLSSKLNTEWEYLCNLKQKGRKAADTWLTFNKEKIGIKDSIHT
jgi:NTE family protein